MCGGVIGWMTGYIGLSSTSESSFNRLQSGGHLVGRLTVHFAVHSVVQ